MSVETPKQLQYSFSGKKVLVTGGGSGVGRALVDRLYHDGAHVFILERDPILVCQLIQDFSDKNSLKAEVCDISEWKKTQALIESFGPMDHLVNCAAIADMNTILDLQEESVDNTFAVNLKSYLCTSQAVAKGMISKGIKGTIVNIASIAGHTVGPTFTIYSISKSGVIMLTKCLAYELGPHGIRANSISPTCIDTPMLKKATAHNPNAIEELTMVQRQPLAGKKVLEKDDVVNSILFLLSPLSSMANGIDLALDGGILAC